MLFALMAVLVGLFLLTKAADSFVEGAVRLAAALRVSPVIIGAVIVGFGTSAPELLVSGLAAAGGNLDIAVGNIVGSNIANLSLVLGVASAIAGISIDSSILRREVPLAAGAALLFAGLLVGGLSRLDGLALLVVLVAALAWLIRGARSSGNDELTAEIDEELHPSVPHRTGVEAVRTVLGLAGTIAGAQLLVTGAVRAAQELGVSQAFIGLTLVAVGTSLPELVTAIVAARKGAHDLIVGNVLGSNVFNSLAVGGIAAAVGPGPLGDAAVAARAVAVMIVVTGLAVVALATCHGLRRREGIALVVVYALTIPLLAV
ncbi:MAG: calcium/sodium antiporter [Acidimicrobiales bacterium]